MRIAEVQVFTFDELSEAAKEHAVAEYLRDIIEHPYLELLADADPIKQAFDEAERMRIPWFVGEIIQEKCNLALILSDSDCEFTAAGRIWCKHLYESCVEVSGE